MQVLTFSILLLGELSTAYTKHVVNFNFYAGSPRSLLIDHSKRETFRDGITSPQRNYMIDLSIGTPAQDASLVIDTGSSDLWLISSRNPLCAVRNETNTCSEESFFNQGDSSSWSSNSTEFNLDTRSGNPLETRMNARGEYGQDNLSVNGKQISRANFAIANETNTTHGRFGIGPSYGEASVTRYESDGTAVGAYDNIPLQMKNQGLISSTAYSLFLNQGQENGTLLFGGVDHSKYTGNLGVIPVLKPEQDGVALKEPGSFSVMLNGAGIKDSAGNTEWLTECAISVVLDSGSTFSYLPGIIVNPVTLAMGARFNSRLLRDTLACDTTGSLLLDFSGVQVEVPFQNMMIPLFEDGSPYIDSTGDVICDPGIFYEDTFVDLNDQYFLGDSILRSLYVVYDLENWEIGIASTKFASDDDDDDDDDDDGDDDDNGSVEEITSGIPSGSSAASYSSTVPGTSYSSATSPTVTGGRGGSTVAYTSRSRTSRSSTSTRSSSSFASSTSTTDSSSSSALSTSTGEPESSVTTTPRDATPGVQTSNEGSSAGQDPTEGQVSGSQTSVNIESSTENGVNQPQSGRASTTGTGLWFLSFFLFFV